MASRIGYVGTESAGDILTTTNFNKLPNGLIGYATATANQTGISSATDLTNLSVTVTVNTSRIIVIRANLFVLQNTSTANVTLAIKESTTQLVQVNQNVVVSTYGQLTPSVILTPSAGSHTYKLTLSTSAGTVDLQAAATYPASIQVYDEGPSF